eukprot:1484434-Amphidinium_carterae.1
MVPRLHPMSAKLPTNTGREAITALVHKLTCEWLKLVHKKNYPTNVRFTSTGAKKRGFIAGGIVPQSGVSSGCPQQQSPVYEPNQGTLPGLPQMMLPPPNPPLSGRSSPYGAVACIPLTLPSVARGSADNMDTEDRPEKPVAITELVAQLNESSNHTRRHVDVMRIIL